MHLTRTAAMLFGAGSLAALAACSSSGQRYGYSWGPVAHPSPSATAANTTAAPLRPELSPNMVKQVQGKLQNEGLYHGQIDGIWGPQTASAMLQYQRKNSLQANGELDDATYRSLGLGSTQNAAGNNNGRNGSSNSANAAGNAPGSANPPAVTGTPNGNGQPPANNNANQ